MYLMYYRNFIHCSDTAERFKKICLKFLYKFTVLKSSGKLSSWNCRHPVIDGAGGIMFLGRPSVCACVLACIPRRRHFLTGFAVDF